MRLGRLFSIVVLGVALVMGTPLAVAADDTVSGVFNKVMCMCGCTSVLENCTHVECGVREAMTTFIRQNLDDGLSADQIVQLFVAQYGEQVLSAPTKRGFNLLPWVLPFVLIGFFGVVIYFVVKKWVKRGEQEQAEATVDGDEIDEEYRARLEKELSEFSERSFR